MDSHIDGLAEVINRMNTEPQEDRISRIDHINLIFIETDVTETILVMTEAMIEAEGASDTGLLIAIEEDTLHSEANPEIKIIQEVHTEDQIIAEMEVKPDNQGSKGNADCLPEDPEMHQGLPAEILT